jgi:hypothetical protein
VGVLAVGGGAVGYVAQGGGAYGVYARGGNASGRYPVSLNTGRRDPAGVRFFKQYEWLCGTPNTPGFVTFAWIAGTGVGIAAILGLVVLLGYTLATRPPPIER